MTALALLALASARGEVARGNAAFEKGELDKALGYYAAAKSEDASSLEIDYDLATAYCKKQTFPKAEEKFRAASRSGDEKLAAKAFLGLGNALVRQGKLKDALAAYRSALDLDPEDKRAQYNHELVRLILKEVEKLAEKLKKKLEELMKKMAELAEETAELASTQARVLRDNWKTAPGSNGPVLTEEEAREVIERAKKGEKIGPELQDKAARLAVEKAAGEGETVEPGKLAQREEKASENSGQLAEKAARLAAQFREAFQGAKVPIPYPEKLERAGARLRSAEEKAKEAAKTLESEGDPPARFRSAEPHETRAMADILAALRELMQPPQPRPQKQEQKQQAQDEQEEKEEERSEVSKAEAERWLEELRQEEKRLRKEARERLRPDKFVEVEKDW